MYNDAPVVGNYDANDTIQLGPVFPNSASSLTFNGISGFTISEGKSTNVLLLCQHNAVLSNGQGIRSYVQPNMIIGTGNYTGATIDNITNAYGNIKIVPGQMYISLYSNGSSIGKSLTKSFENNHPLMSIKLSADKSEKLIVNSFAISLNYLRNANDSDFTNIRVYQDNIPLGTYTGNDILLSQNNTVGAGKVLFNNISGLTVYSNNINYALIVMGHKAMNSGDGVKGSVLTNSTKEYGYVSGGTNTVAGKVQSILKIVPGTIFIYSLTNGNVANTVLSPSPEYKRELLSLKISASPGENITPNSVDFSLMYANGTTNSQLTNLQLYIDKGTIGTYDSGVDVFLSAK